MSIQDISAALKKLECNVECVRPEGALSVKLQQAAQEGRPLVIKLGFDPTAPDLHLGHAVVLKKLKAFQELGHQAVIIVGDYTAAIGDPTGRNKLRPPLTEKEIHENAVTYLDQLKVVLDASNAAVKHNSVWLSRLSFSDIIKLVSQVTVAQMLQREDFATRYDANTPIFLHEFLYPLMQGFDSVAIKADIELGGVDQLFNCLMGRTLQEYYHQRPQVVLCMPLLVGLDGVEKMSKSKKNYIGLKDAPQDMYGKIMSIPDTALVTYLKLVTDFDEKKIQELQCSYASSALHPLELKKMIAFDVVQQYHGLAQAEAASQYFYQQFQSKNNADKVYEIRSLESLALDMRDATLLDLCAALLPDKTRSQLRRLIIAGAVSMNHQKYLDPTSLLSNVPLQQELCIKIGKHDFFSIKSLS